MFLTEHATVQHSSKAGCQQWNKIKVEQKEWHKKEKKWKGSRRRWCRRRQLLFNNFGGDYSRHCPHRSDRHRMLPWNCLQQWNTFSSTSQQLQRHQFCLQSMSKKKSSQWSYFSISQGLIKSSLLSSNYSSALGFHSASPQWCIRWKGLNNLCWFWDSRSISDL